MRKLLVRRPASVMGNVTRAREESRQAWGFRRLQRIWQDARLALRGLRWNRLFGAAISSLALGIGVNTAIFFRSSMEFY